MRQMEGWGIAGEVVDIKNIQVNEARGVGFADAGGRAAQPGFDSLEVGKVIAGNGGGREFEFNDTVVKGGAAGRAGRRLVVS